MFGKMLAKQEEKQTGSAFSVVVRACVALLIAAIILLNVFTHVFQIVRYNGTGMEPNLHNKQTLVLLKTQKVEAGDIIAFYYNNQVLVRRVICTGGSQIMIYEDGSVQVDTEMLEEPYLDQPALGQCNITLPFYVQNGHVFVMGDNRTVAMDSRLSEVGTIPTERIIGKVMIAI